MKSVRFTFVFAFLLLCCAPAWAKGPEIDTRVTQFHVAYHLNDDVSDVATYRWAMKVLTERGLSFAKQTSISYSTSIQKAEVLAAYTQKADGRRIDVPKTNYQLEINRGKGKDSPLFSDLTTLTVVFPEVAIGDTVVLAYKIIQTEPMFPGQFSVSQSFPRTYAYDDVKVRISYPAALHVQYEGRQMTQRVEERGGRKVVEWTFANKTPVKSKRRDYSVYDIEQVPGYAFSTFRSYEDIANAYGVRALPKAVPNARVRALADKLTAGAKTPRDQARALYDWVATHIHYAGNCVGVGAVVPHDLDLILDNRLGDCKDHATLLQALLAAKGIASTQALVNAGSQYRLPRIPVVSAVNHVINYVPSLKLYLDSTASDVPFGMLPFVDAGKPVLRVDGAKTVAYTPVIQPGTNRQIMKTVATIGADGSVRGRVEVSLHGMFAVTTRAWMRDMSQDRQAEWVKDVLRGEGRIGSGTLERPDPKALADRYRYAVKFTVKDFVQRPGAGAFAIAPFFYSDAPIARFAAAAVQRVENVDVACSNGTSVEEYVFHFPKGMKILAVPDDASLANDFLSYRATYTLRGNTLTVKRVFDDRTHGDVCTPATLRAYQQFAAKAQRNAAAQVLYK